MGEDEFQVGMVAQHAAKDQVMNGNGGIERIADHIDQIMVSKAACVGKPGRVHENQEAQLLDASKNLAKPLG
jgi:hypothetical protein